MIPTLIIVFREVLEAMLVVGIAMAASKEIQASPLWVYGGVVGGLIVAALVAVSAEMIAASASGMGQELFNALVLLSAALLMSWTAIWMRRHGKELSDRVRETCERVNGGTATRIMLSVVVGLAVAREGSEVVLFLHGVAVAGERESTMMLTGGVIGLLLGIAITVGLYRSLLFIQMRQLFSVVTILIVFLAAGMASQGTAYLVMIDTLPALGDTIWNTSGIIPGQSILGQLLHALIGYDDRPSGMQVLAFVFTISATWLAIAVQDKGLPRRSAGKVSTAVILCMSLSVASGNADAKKIYSPIVEEGELEFEYILDYSLDHDPAKDGSARHQFELEYGVTDRWMTALVGDYRKRPEQSFAYQGLKWENIYQLYEQGERWLDAGLYFEYIIPDSSLNKADALEFKLLLERESSKLINTTNLVLKKELGQYASKITTVGVNWRSRWRWNRKFEPALEYYGSFGELGNSGPVAQQSHQAGPIISGELAGKIGYEVGYLFGLTPASDAGMVKVIMGYEF